MSGPKPLPPQALALAEALHAAFPSRAALSGLARSGLNESLERISSRRDTAGIAQDFVEFVWTAGTISKLARAALSANPGNARLRRVAADLGVAADISPLEALLGPSVDLASWRSKFGETASRICRVGSSGATGVLVGPDSIVTTAAGAELLRAGRGAGEPAIVFEDDAPSGDDSGSTYKVAWGSARIDVELGIAVIHVLGDPGRATIGHARGLTGASRGWVVFADDPIPEAEETYFVVRRAENLQTTACRASRLPGRPMAAFSDPRPVGGGICFDKAWALVGVVTSDGAHFAFPHASFRAWVGSTADTESSRVSARSVALSFDETSPAGSGAIDLDEILRGFQPSGAEHLEEEKERVDDDARWSYRCAAAVLAYFVSSEIAPLEGSAADHPGALSALLSESRLVRAPGQPPRWTLGEQARRAALRRMGIEGARKALEANRAAAWGSEPLQQVLTSALRGESLTLRDDPKYLRDVLQVIDWVGGMAPGLPSEPEVRRLSARAALLEPFRHVGGEHFRGRRAELARLSDYVGILDASGAIERVSRGLRHIFSLEEQPPLVICGRGGVGKSALLGRFILDHVERLDETRRIPFVYFDFDRPGLTADDPATLLLDGIRQIRVQYPAVDERAAMHVERWSRELAKLERRRGDIDASAAKARRLVTLGHPERERMLDDVKELVQSATGKTQIPLLLVLDTFEEVQSRGRAYVENVWRLLEGLQQRLPLLRTVIVGRAPMDGVKTQTLELGDLDREAAIAFFQHALGREDAPLAATIVEQVGCNPLSLKLAVEVVRLEDATAKDGIRALDSGWLWRPRRIRDEMIKGVLYRRILEHVRDKDVQKLAHPGLVLRRITPTVIRSVLAAPCEVEVADDARAQELFASLERQVSLVRPGSDGALYHRSDVRRQMLEALRRDKPRQSRDIQERAIAFYEAFTDPVSRAEEIYHRLAIGEDPKSVDRRWISGLDSLLSGALAELPPRAQAYLANQLKIDIPPDLRRRIDLDEWELYAARTATSFLELSHPQKALAALRERTERSPASPLFLIEARALVAVGDARAAAEVLHVGIASVGGSGDSDQLVDLSILAGMVEGDRGRFALAQRVLAEAEPMARQAADEDALLEIGVRRLELARKGPADERPPPGELRRVQDEVMAILDRMPREKLTHQNRALALRALDEVLEGRPELRSRMRGSLAELVAGVKVESEDVADVNE